MYFSIFLMSFGVVFVYIVGMGNVILSLFGVSDMVGVVVFWVLVLIVVYKGFEVSGKIELVMSFVMFFFFIVVMVMILFYVEFEKGFYVDFLGFWSIIGVVIFVFGCYMVIFDVYKGFGSYEEIKKVVVWVFIILMVIYVIFMVIFLFVFGRDIL